MAVDLDDVPAPEAGEHYEVWVLRKEAGGEMEAVGVFTPTTSSVDLEFRLPGPGDYEAVDVSVEEDGGPAAHSGTSSPVGSSSRPRDGPDEIRRRGRRGSRRLGAAGADQRVFRCDYSDVAILGKAVTAGPRWWPAGLALHVANGVAFGLFYHEVRPAAHRAATAGARDGPGRARRALSALPPRRPFPPAPRDAGHSRRSFATAARSRRRPGDTRCSASCSGGSPEA